MVSPVRFLGPWLLLAVLLAPPLPAAAQQIPELSPNDVLKAEQLREDMRRMMGLARDRVFPALVNIEVITVNFWNGKEQKGKSVGSGTIISADGHILTNYHVAENGRKFKVTLADKQELTAELVGEDPLTDLAVLKIDPAAVTRSAAPLRYADFGDSDELQIGDTVMAMGSPWALSRSVTRGSISNVERILTGDDDDAGEMLFDEDQRTGIFNQWIQHDAPINPGNSGGPLVNLKGEIIGINTRGNMMADGLAFAIPSNVARAVAAAIIEHGEVPRSFYGLSFKAIKRTGREEGVLVNSIIADGPAEKAGLKAGDVITAVDGEPLTIRYAEQIPPLLKRLADRPIGSQVAVEYERDGARHTAIITTERLERDRGDEAAFRGWGITAQQITANMARNRRLASTDGVLVSSIRPASPAALAEPSITWGDVIVAINGKRIHGLAEFIDAYSEIMEREERPEHVLIEFDRNGTNQVTLVEPKADRDDDPPREVAKAWIGIETQVVLRPLAEQLGNAEKVGFRIARVYQHTRAEDSTLRVGDIITAINGEPIRPRRMEDAGLFSRRIRQLDFDEQAVLTVYRDGRDVEVTVPLERTRLTPEEALRELNRDFELGVRDVTFFDRDANRWSEDTAGVIVTSVEGAGWAGLGGLRPGDLIQRIDDEPIDSVPTFRRVMDDLARRKPERVEFLVLRGVSTNFLYVEPEWSPVVEDAADDGSQS